MSGAYLSVDIAFDGLFYVLHHVVLAGLRVCQVLLQLLQQHAVALLVRQLQLFPEQVCL